MPARRLHWCVGAMAVTAALVLAGCASSSTQTAATAYLHEHTVITTRAAATAKAIEAEVSRLSSSPTRSQLARLVRIAAQTHRSLLQVSQWNVAGHGEEGAEEEDLPRTETELTEGAAELANAMSALQRYARAPSAAALIRCQSMIAGGRSQWNEGISQLWYLAHASNPPTV